MLLAVPEAQLFSSTRVRVKEIRVRATDDYIRGILLSRARSAREFVLVSSEQWGLV